MANRPTAVQTHQKTTTNNCRPRAPRHTHTHIRVRYLLIPIIEFVSHHFVWFFFLSLSLFFLESTTTRPSLLSLTLRRALTSMYRYISNNDDFHGIVSTKASPSILHTTLKRYTRGKTSTGNGYAAMWNTERFVCCRNKHVTYYIALRSPKMRRIVYSTLLLWCVVGQTMALCVAFATNADERKEKKCASNVRTNTTFWYV